MKAPSNAPTAPWAKSGTQGTGPTVPAKKASRRQSFSSFPKAKALYDYAASGDEDLALKQGDIVHILEKFDDGWWSGHSQGRTGLFPGSYVQML